VSPHILLYSYLHDCSFAKERLEKQIRMETRKILIDMPGLIDLCARKLLISILIVNRPLFRFGLHETCEITAH
jgi:hypothetical protein